MTPLFPTDEITEVELAVVRSFTTEELVECTRQIIKYHRELVMLGETLTNASTPLGRLLAARANAPKFVTTVELDTTHHCFVLIEYHDPNIGMRKDRIFVPAECIYDALGLEPFTLGPSNDDLIEAAKKLALEKFKAYHKIS